MKLRKIRLINKTRIPFEHEFNYWDMTEVIPTRKIISVKTLSFPNTLYQKLRANNNQYYSKLLAESDNT